MEVLNLSAEPLGRVLSWLPAQLKAERVVFLPDACPGKSPLPTGTAVLTRQNDWRRFAVSDCGCGMRLLRSSLKESDLTRSNWSSLADILRSNKNGLGDLGGGNHFLDALLAYDEDRVYFLIHTGSRNESGLVDDLVESPFDFDIEFERVVEWARDNRSAIHDSIERVFGSVELVLDMPHNTFEKLEDNSVIIRKGSVRVHPGEQCVIPSHMSGDIVLAEANAKIEETLFSMSHGTGRRVSRSECKPLADGFDFERLRETVMLPEGISNSSLRTEGPYAYRELDECMELVKDYVREIQRFAVVAYMGHL